MDKKRLDVYRKKLQAKREELVQNIARTEEEGRTADEDTTVDLADKAREFLHKRIFVRTDEYRTKFARADRRRAEAHQGWNVWRVRELRRRNAAKAFGRGALGRVLHRVPGKERDRATVIHRHSSLLFKYKS